MLWMRPVFIAAGFFALSAFAAAATAAADDAGFDIVGLKLGMTPEEVRQALVAYGVPPEQIQEARMSYVYSDGLKHDYSTEDFLVTLMGGKLERVNGARREDSLLIYFSPPPQGGRLVGIERLLQNRVDPVTKGELREALIGKYGPATAEAGGVMHWRIGGAANCLSSSPNGIGVRLPEPTGRNRKSILEMVYQQPGGQLRLDLFQDRRVKSLEECGSMLEYHGPSGDYTAGQPATRVSATMIDVQAWVAAELAANEYVEALRQEAIKKREGQGNKPAL
jgi:hypothetical protein